MPPKSLDELVTHFYAELTAAVQAMQAGLQESFDVKIVSCLHMADQIITICPDVSDPRHTGHVPIIAH